MPVQLPIYLLECPSNLGLKATSRGHQPGVRHLPDWLKSHGLHELLQPVQVTCLEPPVYGMETDPESGVRNADQIALYARQQAEALTSILDNYPVAVVPGGDCSVLIGLALGLRQKGRYGLFFLDGHTDFMWPALSRTGGAAGMDLAIVTGYGHDKLTNIHNLKPYFEEGHVFCVGNREYTGWYVNAIESSNIQYWDLNLLRQSGMETCVRQFSTMIQVNQLDGFWIHLDVDVLNNDIMPAVDSPQPGGLTYEEFGQLLTSLAALPQFTGINLGILDPELDPGGFYSKPFVQQFCSALLAGLQSRHSSITQ